MSLVTDDPSGNQLTLLHLSDIHFREPYCLDPSTDQEHSVRQLLLNDLEAMIKKIGPIDVMLLTGDIAFKGHSDEYSVAKTWLFEVARISGCKETSIYIVPGNHDVDRSAAKHPDVLSLRQQIMATSLDSGRDKKLHDSILNDKSAVTLLQPIENYNLFAAAFKCNVSKNPFWTQTQSLAPGWNLVIHGLNSTLFSGPDNDSCGSLYLGALQHVFAKENGIIRLAMLHHPPEWFEDLESIDDSLWDGCEIQLIGHKHRQRYLPSDTAIRYSAGAVNPSRADGKWEPGYNLINIQLIESEKGPTLHIESHLRILQSSPDKFVPKKTRDGKEVFTHNIHLHREPASNVAQSNPGAPVAPEASETVDSPSEEQMETLTRDIALKFWSLTTSQRWLIVKSLNLLEEGDISLPEPLRYERAFERARLTGKSGELAYKIDSIE